MAKLTVEDFRSFPLFRDLGAETLAALGAASIMRDYGPGEMVVGHNDTTFDVFFLMSGKLNMSLYSADGQRVGFHEMAPGGMFGEISAVDGLPRSVSVEAATRCSVAMLPRQRFLAMIEQNPGFAMAVTRQLAASEDALDAVLSLNVAPALVLSAQDGKVLQANFAAQALLGAGLADEGRADQFFAEPAQYDSLRGAILAGGAGIVQLRLRPASGAPFWASVSGARISYEKQDAIVMLVTDIDQLYQAAAELEAALDVERQTSEAQRRCLAIASHEFRTPLAIIDSAAQRLERSAASMSPDQVRGRASRVRATVKRLLQLLDSTIERARDNLGSMGYAPQTGDLGRLITEVAQVFRESTPRLELSVHLPPLPEMPFDRALMERAFGNLVANAIKYSSGDPRVEISGEVTSEDVTIRVRDWGIGIPPEERERVFSDYVRGTNVGTTPGTGLGLSIVSQIIGLHGGLVEVVDTQGPGTTVRIVLPRR